MIARSLTEKHGYAVRPVCEFLELSSSSYYYHSQHMAERQLKADLERVAGQHPTYARRQIGAVIQDAYMTKRIHSALGHLTPAEFENAWWRSQILPIQNTP